MRKHKHKVVNLKKRKEKKEKLILYEAFLHEKYKNCNQEEEIDIGEIFFKTVKNILWITWNLFLYAMTGVALLTLLNDSTRRAFCELLSL